ncbi:MAG: ornithine cyclodeaminase [Clostridia bacterium]|nr:ornithine cyclodeaminase [Clostridia bacterium]
MKAISFDTITGLNISPYTCYEWVSDAIAHKADAVLPAKTSLKPGIEGVFYNTMPVLIPPKVGGVKEVTRYPKRVPSLDSQILLYDLQTGQDLALLDGNWITAMRTGAVAAHSIKLLANPDFSTLGFIGLGNTARAALLVLLALYPDRPMTVKLKKYKDQHESFAERFKEYANVTFLYCDEYEDVVRESDVVVSAATVFETDICSDDCFKEGVLVVPIHTRGFTNCDLFFDKVFADDVNHVKGFRYFSQFKSFAEVADVVSGQKPGRENSRERILAYNIGIALHDIYFASKIYEMCGENCPEVNLNPPTAKFWV